MKSRRSNWGAGLRGLIGINTGCAAVIPHKKLTVQMHRQMIDILQLKFSDYGIVLLGGPEDTLRNQQIAEGKKVIQSPTELGLRDGLVSVAACDVVITGDSLGMHMAISQTAYTVAWFGPTCAHEIDFFDRGESVLTKAPCSPCWKRVCQNEVMCYDQVDLEEVTQAVARGLERVSQCQSTWSYKLPSSEISF